MDFDIITWYMKLSLFWRAFIGIGGFMSLTGCLIAMYAAMGVSYEICNGCGEREFDHTHGHCRKCGHGEPEL